MKYTKKQCESFLKDKKVLGEFYEFFNENQPFQYVIDYSFDVPKKPTEIIFFMKYKKETLETAKNHIFEISPNKDQIVLVFNYKEFFEFTKN
jgi:hypothetical protein